MKNSQHINRINRLTFVKGCGVSLGDRNRILKHLGALQPLKDYTCLQTSADQFHGRDATLKP